VGREKHLQGAARSTVAAPGQTSVTQAGPMRTDSDPMAPAAALVGKVWRRFAAAQPACAASSREQPYDKYNLFGEIMERLENRFIRVR
jgi:hypothetical protein